jgi:hypothetical protein
MNAHLWMSSSSKPQSEEIIRLKSFLPGVVFENFQHFDIFTHVSLYFYFAWRIFFMHMTCLFLGIIVLITVLHIFMSKIVM